LLTLHFFINPILVKGKLVRRAFQQNKQIQIQVLYFNIKINLNEIIKLYTFPVIGQSLLEKPPTTIITILILKSS